MAPNHLPTISIVVCTRNRPRDMQRCLGSLLRLRGPRCQVVVVDQSPGPETKAVVRAGAFGHPEIEYLASDRTGLSAARNEGAARCHGDLLLFTDDDCEVAADWVEAWQRFFHARPTTGVAFGRVTVPPYDPATGHIPHFVPAATRSWGPELLWRGASHVGMGANMALRRDVWRAVGGFDEGLGAGAAFPAAEEIDLVLRILRGSGTRSPGSTGRTSRGTGTGSPAATGRTRRVGHAGTPSVVHHGFRATRDASALVKGYATATGAMYMKHVRCRDLRAAAVLATEVGRLAGRVSRGLVTNTRPLGANSLLGLLRGSVTSLRQPVNHNRRAYLPYQPPAQVARPRRVAGRPASTAS